jgi:ATP-binding cassette subfamily C protein CydC
MSLVAAAPVPLRRLVRLGRPVAGRLLSALALGVATLSCSIGLMATSAWLIARAAQHPVILELQVAIVGVRAFGLFRGVFRYAERLVAHDATLRLLAGLRVRLFSALVPLVPAAAGGSRSGDLASRVVNDVESIQDLFVRCLLPAGVAVVSGLAAVGVATAILPAAGLVLGAGLLNGGVVVPALAAARGRLDGHRLAAQRGALAAEVVDLVHGAPELVAYGAAQAHLDRLAAVDADLARSSRALALAGAVGSGLGSLASGGTVCAVLAVGIPAVYGGRLDGLLLPVLALLSLAAFEAVAPLPVAFARLEAIRSAGDRIVATLDAAPPVTEPALPAPLPPLPAPLVVEGGRFRYRPAGPPVLDGVDLALPPGGRVAIVGSSGAGKSTLASVLLRFVELDAGRVILGGTDVTRLTGDDLRRVVGLVAEDAHVFAGTLRDNLLLARPDATPEELEEAARAAHLLDWVGSLPQGWDTPVASSGAGLSGGQRQRLALARALLAGFPILILDEPTANLDPATERAVLGDLLDGAAGRSILLITHVLDVLDDFDEIVVLEGGRVVERGRHADLLAAGGRYRRLWDLEHQPVPVTGPLQYFE